MSRPVYNYVDVTGVPDFSPEDGSILYFQNGEISTNFLGFHFLRIVLKFQDKARFWKIQIARQIAVLFISV